MGKIKGWTTGNIKLGHWALDETIKSKHPISINVEPEFSSQRKVIDYRLTSGDFPEIIRSNEREIIGYNVILREFPRNKRILKSIFTNKESAKRWAINYIRKHKDLAQLQKLF